MKQKEPEWVARETALGLHAIALAQHGGLDGIRDEGLLESAFAKPRNLYRYGRPTIFELAASYAYGIVMNHPFLDGNKRTGFVVAILFLELNGHRFKATEVDAAIQTLALAAGALSEAEFAAWLKRNSRR